MWQIRKYSQRASGREVEFDSSDGGVQRAARTTTDEHRHLRINLRINYCILLASLILQNMLSHSDSDEKC